MGAAGNRAARFLSIAGGVILALGATAASAHNAGWKSGVMRTAVAEPQAFANWRGTPLGVAIGWIQWRDGGWKRMYEYASGNDIRVLRRASANVSLGQPLFPTGGSVWACAHNQYDANHREVARRLVANGVGNAEIRLGWEGNGDWFPWAAAGTDPANWRACFVNAARAFKSVSSNFRIAWSMSKKGRLDVRKLWPAGNADLISNICLSVYADPWVRWGQETYEGGPYGLRAWLDFAKAKGKKLCIGEWGVGLHGDDPAFVQKMHDFLTYAMTTGAFAHEGYWNNAKGRLYPTTSVPKSAALYRQLF
jgi:hypothetical protein